MKTINYEASWARSDYDIKGVAAKCTRLAKQQRRRVKIDFNGTILYATPKKSPTTIVWEYHQLCGQNWETWCQSKCGQSEQGRLIAQEIKAQDAITALAKTLVGLVEINNMDHLMGWIDSFIDNYKASVDIDEACNLKRGGFEWLAILFQSKGYKVNAHVSKITADTCTRQQLGEYIIGQTIDAFQHGHGPHQRLQDFIRLYFKLKEDEAKTA